MAGIFGPKHPGVCLEREESPAMHRVDELEVGPDPASVGRETGPVETAVGRGEDVFP